MTWLYFLLCAVIVARVLLPSLLALRGPKDRRTLAEKNWDWIMGPELPSTCQAVGHSYTIDPHECDWCGAGRWLTIHGRRSEKYLGFWEFHDSLLVRYGDGEEFQTIGGEAFVVVPSRAPVYAKDDITDPIGNAGTCLDSKPSSVRSSEDEARQEASEAATAARRRQRDRTLAEARWNTRDKASAYAPIRQGSSNPGGYNLSMERMEHLKRQYEANLMTTNEVRAQLGHVIHTHWGTEADPYPPLKDRMTY